MTMCEGCGQSGATEELWYPEWRGSRPVALHASRSCAVAARDRLGGRPFLSEQDAALLRNMAEYCKWLHEVWAPRERERRAT